MDGIFEALAECIGPLVEVCIEFICECGEDIVELCVCFFSSSPSKDKEEDDD